MDAGTQSLVRTREMTSDDVVPARALSRELNWPHRTADWSFLLEVGSGIVAERDGQVVGTAMSWRYGEDAATLGLVIVSPRCQGKGIGRRLMQETMDRLGERSIMLHATEEGLSLYRSLGFVPTDTILQHQGTAFSVPIPQLRPNERVRPLVTGDRETIIELDRRATGMDRSALLARLIADSRGVVLTRDTEPYGFALYRRFGRGHAVGPTVAPDLDAAKALISHWLGSRAGMFCRLDVSEGSGLSEWLDDLGLHAVGKVTQMVRGSPPARDGAVKLYSLVSQALG